MQESGYLWVRDGGDCDQEGTQKECWDSFQCSIFDQSGVYMKDHFMTIC